MDHNTLTWNGRGWVEGAPAECPNGHPLVGGRVLVGSHVCSCEIHHHRTHRCRLCNATTYTPDRGPDCQDNAFDGRGADRLGAMGKKIIVTLADGGRREYDCDEPLAATNDDTGTLAIQDGGTVYATFTKGEWTDVKIVPLS